MAFTRFPGKLFALAAAMIGVAFNSGVAVADSPDSGTSSDYTSCRPPVSTPRPAKSDPVDGRPTGAADNSATQRNAAAN